MLHVSAVLSHHQAYTSRTVLFCVDCVVLCTVCVSMCTVLLPPGVYPIAVKYIISYHITTVFQFCLTVFGLLHWGSLLHYKS